MDEKAKLILLVGEGQMPRIVAEQAMKRGAQPFFIPVVPNFIPPQNYTKISSYVPVTKISHITRMAVKFGATEAVVVGRIPKTLVAHARLRDYDMKTYYWLKKRIGQQDDTAIFSLIEEEFNKAGIPLVSQAKYLEDLLNYSGNLTKKKPTKAQERDIDFGLGQAKELGKLNIGQTIVVKKRTVLTVEDIQGTDACIDRAKDYTGGKGAVVCKVERPLQDLRYDIPTVGLETLRHMRNSGCDVLAIEERKTFMVNAQEMIQFANENNMSVVTRRISAGHNL